jgi:hypothetical protein
MIFYYTVKNDKMKDMIRKYKKPLLYFFTLNIWSRDG